MSDKHSQSQPEGFGPEHESWYEPVRREPTLGDRLVSLLKFVVVLLILGGLLYISGIYQSTFLATTSPEAEPGAAKVLVEGERLELPLTVVAVAVQEEDKVLTDKREVEELVAKASRIWDRAKIDLVLRDYSVVRVEEKDLVALLNDPRHLLEEIPKKEREGITVFLIHSLRGVNGIAFVGNGSIALAEFTSVYNFRVLAHEVGHILDLGHVSHPRRLMDKSARGEGLTRREAEKAREAAVEILNQR